MEEGETYIFSANHCVIWNEVTGNNCATNAWMLTISNFQKRL